MSWFRIVNAGEKKARLDIYDTIGQFTDWWTGETKGVAARDFSAALEALGDVEAIELHINSAGGSVPDGIQIYNELKRHPAQITGYIDGQAASIASLVAMAPDELIMPANTSLWVHDPAAWLDAWGYLNAKELRDTAEKVLDLADDLDTTREQLVGTYLAKAGDKISREDLVGMMEKETTITAEQAVEWGLADRIEDPLQQAAHHDMATIREAARKDFTTRLAKVSREPTPADPPPQAPQPMDARALVTACREAGFAALAPGLIEAGLTEPQVAAQLAEAREINDIAAAADLEHGAIELIAAEGKVEGIRHALALRMDEDDQIADIRNHPPSDGGGKEKVTKLAEVMAHRRKRFHRSG